MERGVAIDRLPPVYAEALRLEADGLAEGEIARRLSIDPDAVDSFFELARSKLAQLEALPDE